MDKKEREDLGAPRFGLKPAHIKVNATGEKITLVSPFEVGRSKKCSLTLDDERVSGHHGVFHENRGEWSYTDLGSSNGSSLNGRGIAQNKPYTLKDGDWLTVGDTIIELFDPYTKELEEQKKAAKRKKAGTSQTSEFDILAKLPSAGLLKRFAAQIIDGAVISVIYSIFIGIPSALLIPILSDMIKENESSSNILLEFFPLFMILASGAIYLYFLNFFVLQRGQTPGKIILNLKIISFEKSQLTLGRVLMREVLGRTLLSILFPLALILYFLNKEKRALHDILGKTRVVDLAGKPHKNLKESEDEEVCEEEEDEED